MDDLLTTMRAMAPDGLFSAADARACGLDRRLLAEAAARGEIERLARGQYLVSPAPDLRELHRSRSIAVVDGLERTGLSHDSGLVVRGLPTFAADLSRVHVTSTRPRKRVPPHVHHWVRRSLVLDEVVVGARTVPALPVADCVVQVGLLRGGEAALVPADAAIRQGSLTVDDLSAALDLVVGHRGVRSLRQMLAWAGGRHETPGETRTGVCLHRLGLAYTPQVWIGQDRVDALLDDEPVVVEFDGALKHMDQDALVTEKIREDRIRSRGYGFVRLMWADLYDLGLVAARVRRAIDALPRRS